MTENKEDYSPRFMSLIKSATNMSQNKSLPVLEQLRVLNALKFKFNFKLITVL